MKEKFSSIVDWLSDTEPSDPSNAGPTVEDGMSTGDEGPKNPMNTTTSDLGIKRHSPHKKYGASVMSEDPDGAWVEYRDLLDMPLPPPTVPLDNLENLRKEARTYRLCVIAAGVAPVIAQMLDKVKAVDGVEYGPTHFAVALDRYSRAILAKLEEE